MKTLLARLPTNESPRKINNTDEDFAKIIRRAKALWAKRWDWEQRWKAIRRIQLPWLGYFEDTADKSNPARRRDEDIYDNTAWAANQVFAGGVASSLTPQSIQWFKLEFVDEHAGSLQEAKEVLDIRQDIMSRVLANTNFYNCAHACYAELAFGQGTLGVFADAEAGVWFRQYTIGTYAFEVDNKGRINTFLHKGKVSAEQLAEQFGEDDLPTAVKVALKNNKSYDQDFALCWLVEPNKNAVAGKPGRDNMRWRSVYWVEGCSEKKFIYQGGFNTWPVPVGRYSVLENEAYGRGPGWWAEGDSKQLTLMARDLNTAVELSVKPPMQAGADTPISLYPGAINKVLSPQIPVQPVFQVNTRVDHLMALIREKQGEVKRAYNADLFLMLEHDDYTQKTATEISIRNQERIQQLGPVVKRLDIDFLTPTLARVYAILEDAGAFPPWPDNVLEFLGGTEIKIEYISPLAQAQKMSGLQNIEQLLAFIGQLAQIKPEVVDKFDAVATIDIYADKLGVPAAVLLSNEEYVKIKQERIQQAQQEQAAQMALAAAPAAADYTKAAANLTAAANDGNPAISKLLGMGGGGI